MGRSGDGDPVDFGALLRSLRHGAELTQEELATRSGVSVRTVRELEAGNVKAPRFSSLGALADALGIDDDERHRFIVAARPGDDVVAGGAAPAVRVPRPIAQLFGRDEEIRQVVVMLRRQSARLVTLTGVAGIGKTRLALAVAEAIEDAGGEIWWVPLSAITDASHVLDGIADKVGAREATPDAIAVRVGSQPTVIAVDDVGHVDGVGGVLLELLEAAPVLSLLATSRGPLGLTGEREWAVGPLAVPQPVDGADGVEVDVLRSTPSVALLQDRVRAGDPRFEARGDDIAKMVEICRAVDGVPLAIELAAGHWRVRGARGVLDAITETPLDVDDLSGATSDAHVSVRRALEITTRLLSDETRSVLFDLSCFRGGWTLESAAAIVAADDLVSHLDRLLRFGLITADDGDIGRRFTMLPIIQVFAADGAEAAGSSAVARKRHAEYFAGWVATFDTLSGHGGDADVIAALDTERDNCRAALAWFEHHDPEGGTCLASQLAPYWWHRGRDAEGLSWFTALLRRSPDDSPRRANTLVLASSHAHFLGRLDEAVAMTQEAMSDAANRDDHESYIEAMAALGMHENVTDPLQAVDHCGEAATLAGSLEMVSVQLWAMSNRSAALVELGRLEDANAAAAEVMTLARRHGNAYHVAVGAVLRVTVARLAGDIDTALRRSDEASAAVNAVDSGDLEVLHLANGAIVNAYHGLLREAGMLAETAQQRAADFGSVGTRREAMFAAAEVALIRGDRREARTLFEQLATEQSPTEPPMRRIEILAAHAATARDPHVAAASAAAARSKATELGITLPPPLQQRLRSAHT